MSGTSGFKVPANTLGLTGSVRVTLVADYLNNTGVNQTCTFRIKFGGTVLKTSLSEETEAELNAELSGKGAREPVGARA